MIQRLPKKRIQIIGGTEEEVDEFIEHDFQIRSGMCPNGCGLMHEKESGQECEKCGFWCNTPAEKRSAQ